MSPPPMADFEVGIFPEIKNNTHCKNETNEPLKNSDQIKTGLKEKRTCSHAYIPSYFTNVKRKQNYTDMYLHNNTQ